MGIVENSWRPGNGDKEHNEYFPKASEHFNVESDRVHDDNWNERLQYDINDTSELFGALRSGDIRIRKVVMTDKKEQQTISCKYRNILNFR